MKEIIINSNEADQRLDRYLRKYLGEANLSFIYKQIRKKNITVNNAKVNEKYLLREGDIIKLFLSHETIENFKSKKVLKKSRVKLDIVYEDSNLVIINKPVGLLSHSTKDDYKEDNVVDALITYLVNKGDFEFRRDSTFTPSLANRLDRNTSGLLIGAKNYNTIQEINKAQKNNSIDKFYKTIVSGEVKGEKIEKALFEKIENKTNQVKISNSADLDKKEVITGYKSLLSSSKYSLLEINLITGRTHQIRAHLAYLKMPIIGDRKYGNTKVNSYFLEKYGLNNQLLHCYKLHFNGLEGDLSYLNDKIITVEDTDILRKIVKEEINKNYN